MNSYINYISKIKAFLLDTFFPIACLCCKKEGEWICKSCLEKIQINTEHVCGICEKRIVPDGRTCHECKRKNPLDALLPATSYDEFLVSHAVHLFKYRFIEDLHVPLASLIIKALSKTELPIADLIVPVPLHPKRLRWRGFNQSNLLAKHISKNLLEQSELKLLENVLIRKHWTSPQMKIKDYKNRQLNICGAFDVTNPKQIAGKTILLIDDVTTTGATIIECAKILKQNGAREVYAAVIARQGLKSI